MRFTGPDAALFVVGLLLFGGASYALYLQGGFSAVAQQTSALGQFDVTFSTDEVGLAPQAATSLRSGEAVFQVNQTNVARLVVRVSCEDQAAAAAPFTVAVQVVGPSNLTGEAEGACGSAIEVPIEVAGVPGETSAPGQTEAEARANLAPDANATRAVGEWTVSFQGGRGATGGLPVDPTAPSGSVAMTLVRWEPDFRALQR